MKEPSVGVKKMLDGLMGTDVLVRLDWDEWLSVNPANEETPFTQREVMTRYVRNGYEWDMVRFPCPNL